MVHKDCPRVDEGMLTSGKRSSQQKCSLEVSGPLTVRSPTGNLSLRWGALLLYLLPDISGYADQLQQILLLPDC
jgi:hypothetical protein